MSAFIIILFPVIIVAVILARAAAFKPEARPNPEPLPVRVDTERAAASLSAMVRCRTVSNRNPDLQDPRQFEAFRQLLAERYPKVHETCSLTRTGANGLLYRWPGGSTGEETVLMAHYDVVPAAEELWSRPPFEGLIEAGVLWGRGTLDTKITLCGVMEAAETLIADGFVPERDIYFCFAGDEEIAGDDAPSIVRELEGRGIRPALVLDEGGAVVESVFPGVSSPCALVGIGEKGILDLEMSLTGSGGHASAPPPHTLLGELARAAVRIESRPFPGRLTMAAAQMFDTLGRHSTFLYRMIFANIRLFRPLLDLICRKSGGELNALMRTTCAITMAEGSSAVNVLPPSAKLGMNLRLISGDSMEAAEEYLRTVVDNERIRITRIDGMNPSPFSRTDSPGWERVRDTIAMTWPEAIVSPYLMIACSDSRHYHRISDNVFRFSVLELSKEERGTIHGNDERIPVEKIGRTVAFYQRLMRLS